MEIKFGTLIFNPNNVKVPFPPSSQELIMEDEEEWISEEGDELVTE